MQQRTHINITGRLISTQKVCGSTHSPSKSEKTTTLEKGTAHTEKPKESPTLSTSEMELKYLLLISTLSFLPTPPFSHFCFLLVQPPRSAFFLSSSASTSSRSQLLRKFSSCMAWYSRSKSPSSLGKAPLSSSILFLVKLKLFLESFAFLPGDPSFFALQFSHHHALLARTLFSSSVKIRLTIFPYVAVSSFPGLHPFIYFGPNLCRA